MHSGICEMGLLFRVIAMRSSKFYITLQKAFLYWTHEAHPLWSKFVSTTTSTVFLTNTLASSYSLQKSYSAEELSAEMANLEGLMKDLNAITQQEFEC